MSEPKDSEFVKAMIDWEDSLNHRPPFRGLIIISWETKGDIKIGSNGSSKTQKRSPTTRAGQFEGVIPGIATSR